jgi:hypothetical protein
MPRPIAHYLVAAGLAILVLTKFDGKTGFTGLIRFGENWSERRQGGLRDLPVATVTGSNGYDGQFYAQIALDPFLRSDQLPAELDAPAYRARRILVPAVAAAAGMGNPWWTLRAYALVNVCCWIALGVILYRYIRPQDGHAFARWLGCMLSLGVLDSVRQSLVDLPAALLLVLAVNSYSQTRPAGSAAWAALANLAKETSLLGSVALYGGEYHRPFPWRRITLVLLMAVLPIAIWSLYVNQRLAGSIKETSLGNFTWPFVGLLMQGKNSLRELFAGNFDSRYSFGLIGIVGLLTQAWFLWSNRGPQKPWWRVGLAYSLLLVFLGPWVWSGYWAACRAVLPMTIAFNLLLPATRAFWPWWIVGNFTVLHAVWRFL